MSIRRHGRIRLSLLLTGVVAAAVTAATGSTFAAQADENTSPDHLVVYNNNIENMVPKDCYGEDFELLMSYIKDQPESPDVFTVQQISNTKQLKAFTKRLSDELPGTYSGEIAIGAIPARWVTPAPAANLKTSRPTR